MICGVSLSEARRRSQVEQPVFLPDLSREDHDLQDRFHPPALRAGLLMATVERWHDSELAARQGPLSLRVEHHPGEMYLIQLFGELDLAGADFVSERLETAAASDCKELVVDLTGLDFIDSTGLGVLVRTNRQAGSASPLRLVWGSGGVAPVGAPTGAGR